jgi:hypothetical protein
LRRQTGGLDDLAVFLALGFAKAVNWSGVLGAATAPTSFSFAWISGVS